MSKEFPFSVSTDEEPKKTNFICPDCTVASPRDQWTSIEFPCDDCEKHSGRVCPNCGNPIDTVMNNLEEI